MRHHRHRGRRQHDCGKGIGIAATHEGDLYQYAGIETLTNPLPPIVAVNTTAGTASEVTRHCVLTNTETKVKFVIVSWRNLPSVSINDPLLMIGKPAALTAATGMDALTHAVEAYISKDANPVTDAAAMQAIRLIARNLRRAVALGSNLQARENMAYASLLAGMAFNNANLGYVRHGAPAGRPVRHAARRGQRCPAAACGPLQPDRQPGEIRRYC